MEKKTAPLDELVHIERTAWETLTTFLIEKEVLTLEDLSLKISPLTKITTPGSVMLKYLFQWASAVTVLWATAIKEQETLSCQKANSN